MGSLIWLEIISSRLQDLEKGIFRQELYHRRQIKLSSFKAKKELNQMKSKATLKDIPNLIS